MTHLELKAEMTEFLHVVRNLGVLTSLVLPVCIGLVIYITQLCDRCRSV